MKNFRKVLLPPDATIRCALEIIDSGSIKIALVADESLRLLGTLTDGDIRRAILSGKGLDDSIEAVYYRTPTTCGINDSKEKILQLAVAHKLYQIPIVDAEGESLDHQVDTTSTSTSNEQSRLMAGVGYRLSPLTNTEAHLMWETSPS
jgi:CBS domain-containing protein